MATQIKLRRDTAANWTSANPTLALGEPGYETDTGKLKIGNGSTDWNTLAYFDDKVTDLSSYAGDIVPSADNTYDLGTPDKRWKHGYFANGSLYVGDIKLSNSNGKLIVQQVTDAGLVTEAPIPNTPGAVTTDRLVNGDQVATLSNRGTLEVPNMVSTTFTATVDAAHYTGELNLTGDAWHFEVTFVPLSNGTVETQIVNNTPWPSNPGYTTGDAFTFTDADHGIHGYTFTLILSDIQNPSQFMWTTNLIAGQPPVQPTTIISGETISLTADSTSWKFRPDGKFQIPAGGDIVDSTGTSVLGGGGNANTGDVTFSGSSLTTPNTTDVGWANGVIRLAPGSTGNATYGDWGQFINIYPTNANDAPHIHIAAGAGIQSKGDLILGDDNQYVDINHNGQIYVKSYDPIRGQQNFWGFDTEGTFWGPGMGTVITPAISGPSGNNLYLTGGNNNVRQSVVVRFTDADGTAKSVYTVDTNTYNVSSITFTNGQPTLWTAPNNNASIASITPGEGTATFDFGSPITLLADTDYTVDWYLINNNANVGNVAIQSPIQQNDSYTRTTNSNPVELLTPTIVWTSVDNWIASAKLMIQIEANETGDNTGWHTQSCEAIIAARANTGDPHMTVYGVTHTSVDPLMTFTVARNGTTNLIEVTATPTATLGTTAYIKIYSVEMISRD